MSDEYDKTWGTPIGQDCINLDTSLAEWLGARLLFMAQHGHSYPLRYKTIEDYRADLTCHGNALTAYAKDKYDTEDEALLIDKATEAMQFVTDNFATLWD